MKFCSFCGRDDREVPLPVIAETGIAGICNHCIAECAGAAAAFARADKPGLVPLDKWRRRARLLNPSYSTGGDPGDAA